MTFVRRFDHVGITVADIDAVTAFFVSLGLEADGKMAVEGEFLDTVIGMTNARTEIVMLRPPGGGTTLELSSFTRPDHLPGSPAAPANELGLGASGAIFGLFGAWFVVSRRLRVDSRAIVFLIVLNLGISFTVSGIAWQAHVGGLIAGGLLSAAYAYAPRNQRALVQIGATVLLVAILVVAVLTRNHQLLSSGPG